MSDVWVGSIQAKGVGLCTVHKAVQEFEIMYRAPAADIKKVFAGIPDYLVFSHMTFGEQSVKLFFESEG